MSVTDTASPCSRPIPVRAGIGLRPPHYDALLREKPKVGWLEAHSENYFGEGGTQLEVLERLRTLYPLSLHGVGLSLGSCDALDRDHLRKLKRLVDRVEPALLSEHLSWGSIEGRHTNDLLPLPYTEAALRHMIARVGQVQDFLGRRVLIENVSSYLQYTTSELAESDFLAELAHRSGCGILLDVNNIYVNACNHGFDASAYLAALPRAPVVEIHLAGHSRVQLASGEILIDTHSAPVCEAVWRLYEETLARFGPLPTLIEWDSQLPALDVLVAEAARADTHLEKIGDLAA